MVKHDLRILIIDDEPRARSFIRKLLLNDPSVEIDGECANGYEAIRAIKTVRPDLIFLDVQMPELDGFAVLEQLQPEEVPAVIFVTAYDQYALRAFETHALDYLLKPFDQERFSRTLEHAKLRIGERKNAHQEAIAQLLANENRRSAYLKRITVKRNGRMLLLRAQDIEWIEAEDNYVLLHSGKDAYILRQTLSNLEGRLDPESFIRVHRSAIVNIEALKEVQPGFSGAYGLELNSGAKLRLSRGYREKFFQKFGYPH
jgi:two-component system, LytTR family, response regulator